MRTAAEQVRGPAPTSIQTHVPTLGVDVHARVWHDDAGNGTPIVLVHGLGLSSRYLVPLGRRLSALGHRVLSPDLPGFGKTPPPAGASRTSAPTVREQADQLVAWMDALGLRSAVLFGNSVGVQVSTEVAARYPDRVERLILEGPSPDPAYRAPWKQYPRVMRNMVFEAPSLNSVFQLEYASAAGVRVFDHLRKTVDDPVEDRLPRITAPSLVVRGRFDQTLSQTWAERFTSLLPDARLVVVEGAAHNVHYTAPHVTARLVDAFVRHGRDGLAPTAGDVVVPGPDHGDPLAPRQPMSTRTHGLLDYASVALCVAAPRLTALGPRTRAVLGVAGGSTALLSAASDYPFGVLRKVPMTVHLNIDSMTGMQLLHLAARVLRGEPAAGRWLVAGLGAYAILAANITRKPMGPARLVDVPELPTTMPALDASATSAAHAVEPAEQPV